MSRIDTIQEAVLAVRPTLILWHELEDDPVRKEAFGVILRTFPDPIANPFSTFLSS